MAGTAPYIYDWSGNLMDNLQLQSNLAGGAYAVTVTDANGCSRPFTNIQVANPEALAVTGLTTNISTTPGAINVSSSGGRAPYRYSWSGPGGFTSTSEDLVNLSIPGTYCLSMLDASDCVFNRCFDVCQSLRIVNDEITQGCAGQNNGSITLDVVGCTTTFTYSWQGPNNFTSAAQNVTGLAAGTYNVTITNGTLPGGQQITASYTLNPTAIVLNATTVSASTGDNGAVNLMVTGGTPPFSYSWTGPNGFAATTANLSNLVGGEYCVTVTDRNNCSRNSCFIVQSIPLTVLNTSTRPVRCSGDANGEATIIVGGGGGTLIALASPGNFRDTSLTDTLRLTLPAGNYTVTITDAFGGSTSTQLTVSSPPALTLPTVILVSDTEDAQCSGSITLAPAGGTAPYVYTWNIPELSGPQVSGICAGDYEAVVTDANGCTLSTAQIMIGQVREDAILTAVDCPGDSTGAIDLSVAGGVAPYSFHGGRNGESTLFATTEDVSSLTNGSYSVTIRDATGASLIRTYSVGLAQQFSVNATVSSNFNGFGVSCFGATDGRLVGVVSGLGVFTYEWLEAGQLVGIDSILANRAAGTYTLRVTSPAGCEQSRTVVLTEPNALTLQVNQTNASCLNLRDGQISLTPSGGVSPYTYLWSNGTTLSRAQLLAAGTYSVTVSGANGCQLSQSFTITQPEAVVATTESTDATDGCNGTVRVLPLGGADRFNFRWLQRLTKGTTA
ncbi:MAG: hypothetical protein HC821_02180 [Lewinella sp.]|nr:hypothetical protein [Lewinella sp.]